MSLVLFYRVAQIYVEAYLPAIPVRPNFIIHYIGILKHIHVKVCSYVGFMFNVYRLCFCTSCRCPTSKTRFVEWRELLCKQSKSDMFHICTNALNISLSRVWSYLKCMHPWWPILSMCWFTIFCYFGGILEYSEYYSFTHSFFHSFIHSFSHSWKDNVFLNFFVYFSYCISVDLQQPIVLLRSFPVSVCFLTFA